jgi:hypothetical protein
MWKPKKKNCYNCKHLDYYDKESYEDSSPEGYFCNGRSYGDRQENCEETHLEKLQKETYLERSKKCCELSIS